MSSESPRSKTRRAKRQNNFRICNSPVCPYSLALYGYVTVALFGNLNSPSIKVIEMGIFYGSNRQQLDY